MKKRALIVIIVLQMLVCIAGCTNAGHEEASSKGVYTQGKKTYYRIDLPSGSRVDDHFELTGNEGTVVMTQVDVNGSGGSQNNGAVYYRAVSQGGWVAYDESKTGIILFLPSEFTADHVQLACSSLVRGGDNYMSFEEAKTYIPWLE